MWLGELKGNRYLQLNPSQVRGATPDSHRSYQQAVLLQKEIVALFGDFPDLPRLTTQKWILVEYSHIMIR